MTPTLAKETVITAQDFSVTRRLERNNLILVLLGTLASLYFQDRGITLSFLAGGALTVFNLHLLRKIVQGLGDGEQVSKKKLLVQVALKFLGAFGFLALALLVLKLDVIAFAAGLSVIVLTMLLEGVWGAIRK